VEAEFDGLGRELMGLDARLSGQVRLTTAPNLAYHYVAPYLRDFRALYPAVVVDLAVTAENRDLSRREADLALRATSRPPQHLVGRKAVQFPWWVFAGECWLARNRAPADMSDLARHDRIGAEDGMRQLPVFRWAERHLPEERVVARSNDLDSMAALAVAGVGLALLPQDQVMPGLTRLFRVTPPVHTQLWLLTHPDLRRVPRIQALMDFVTERLRADPRLQNQNGTQSFNQNGTQSF
jgi:DNA-binding transcriptional LysR family regulator